MVRLFHMLSLTHKSLHITTVGNAGQSTNVDDVQQEASQYQVDLTADLQDWFRQVGHAVGHAVGPCGTLCTMLRDV